MNAKRFGTIIIMFLFSLLFTGCRGSTVPMISQAAEPSASVDVEKETPQKTPTNFVPSEIDHNAKDEIEDSVDLQVSSIDGMKMVFVPPGEFLMGSEKGVGDKDEEPQHVVKLKGYWIDQIEVTAGMYGQCVNAGVCSPPKPGNSYSNEIYFGNPDYSNYPVIFVDWYQAKKYCQWAGRRLPTEAEWEMAARGTENFIFPWGNTEPDQTLANYDYHSSDVAKTGSYPNGASPFGVLDMAGNVAEWVSDWYDVYPLYADPNPKGPANGKYNIVRGGSWITGEYLIRSADRYWVTAFYVDEDTGFRCALSK